MLAALSVTHGFIPPHPSPVALASQFNANLGITLIYGLIIAVPAIIVGGPVLGSFLKNIKSGSSTLFKQTEDSMSSNFKTPGTGNSFITALLPVVLLIIVTILPYVISKDNIFAHEFLSLIGAPSVVMLLAIIFATYSLGLKLGRGIKEVMDIYGDAVKDIAMILLIIAGSGIFKQIMEDSSVSAELAKSLGTLPIHPLILAWIITAIIRGCVGSATVAALTAAGVLMPLIMASGIEPSLMVLSIGAGSLMFSHVNDTGFWLFKEYFALSIKDTLCSWSVMEAVVSIMGLIGVMILNLIIG